MKNVPARKANPLPVDRSCSVANTLTILADRWTFLVLREAFFGARHYDEFRGNLGVATNVLSHRLKSLVENGILSRKNDEADKRRFIYRLTEKGLDLYGITLALMKWGDKWLAGKEGPPLVLRHEPCGKRLDPVMSCRACGGEIVPQDVSF